MGTSLFMEKSTPQMRDKWNIVREHPTNIFESKKKKIYATFLVRKFPNLENYSKNFYWRFFLTDFKYSFNIHFVRFWQGFQKPKTCSNQLTSQNQFMRARGATIRPDEVERSRNTREARNCAWRATTFFPTNECWFVRPTDLSKK